MKLGRTLTELATEIERQRDTKKDFIAPTNLIAINNDAGIEFGPNRMVINDVAHGQIAEHTGVPQRYYNKMRAEAPDLLATNVNRWFEKYPAPRMLRTLDDRLRAFVSDSFRPLENYDLCEAVLPTIADLNLEVLSCEVTERRLFIKAVDKSINADIPKNSALGRGHDWFDTISPAIFISNSEVGMGALTVETGIWTHLCTNLAVMSQSGMKRRHVGAKLGGEEIQHLLTDDTRRATDRAVWMQVRDVVKGAFEEARFDAQVLKLKGMVAEKIEGDPIKVVELTGKRLAMTEGERTSVLRHLIEGGDLSKYGLFNAVTRTAEDLPSYDRASEFEKMGGEIVELPSQDWQRLAMAA